MHDFGAVIMAAGIGRDREHSFHGALELAIALGRSRAA
jgi:hypothetical protein